jgi:hypothetical protein
LFLSWQNDIQSYALIRAFLHIVPQEPMDSLQQSIALHLKKQWFRSKKAMV